MKVSMFQIAFVTAIARCMAAIRVDFAFPSPTTMFFSPIKMNRDQSDTSQQNAHNAYDGMESKKETSHGYFEQEAIQKEAHKVREIVKRKFSQQSHNAKKWTRITPEMEEMVKRDAYKIFFDSADLNFDGRMELEEVAILLASFGMNDMPMRDLKRSFRIMDDDSNGFVDMYEWNTAGPQFLPMGVNKKK